MLPEVPYLRYLLSRVLETLKLGLGFLDSWGALGQRRIIGGVEKLGTKLDG